MIDPKKLKLVYPENPTALLVDGSKGLKAYYPKVDKRFTYSGRVWYSQEYDLFYCSGESVEPDFVEEVIY